MKMIRIILVLFLLTYVKSTSIDIRYPQFFHQNNSIVAITEGKTAGSFIAFINLINSTNINDWILNTTHEDFEIQSNGISYSLITTKILDRERENFYNFSIIAQQLHLPFEKLSKTISIRILDINDCIPSFNQTIYRTTLIPNESNFTIQAFDCDEPNTENSRISYSLSNYQDLFHINETTGVIQCIKNLNTYEDYQVIVLAYDHGKPSLSSTCLVQIQLISSKSRQSKSLSWLKMEQKPANMLILAGILASCFVFCSLLVCLICCIKYKIQRRKEKKYSSSSSINSSTNDYQEKTIYDAINIFPNTLYLPVKQQLPQTSSSTTSSSPKSTNDMIMGKIGSDDGCYCSSDISSEQSNNILLLNPSSLTSKHVRFNQTNQIDGVIQRFENLYKSQTITDHHASYV